MKMNAGYVLAIIAVLFLTVPIYALSANRGDEGGGGNYTNTTPANITKQGADGTWCYNSDENSGNVYNVKGYCQDNSGTHNDYCDGSTVRDYYCGGIWNGTSWRNVKCEAGGFVCSSAGLACSDGACINANTTNTTCTDSDGGINYYTKGTTTICTSTSQSGGCGVFADTCTGSILKEGYCENSLLKTINYTCPYGCREGVCVADNGTTPEYKIKLSTDKTVYKINEPMQLTARVSSDTSIQNAALTFIVERPDGQVERVIPYAGGGSCGGQDTTPPIITINNPINGSTIKASSTTLEVATNENAKCKYSIGGCSRVEGDESGGGGCFGSMFANMSITGGTSHSQVLTNLSNNTDYTISVKCSDYSGNSNTASMKFFVRLSGNTTIQKPRIEPQPVSPPATGAVIARESDESDESVGDEPNAAVTAGIVEECTLKFHGRYANTNVRGDYKISAEISGVPSLRSPVISVFVFDMSDVYSVIIPNDIGDFRFRDAGVRPISASQKIVYDYYATYRNSADNIAAKSDVARFASRSALDEVTKRSIASGWIHIEKIGDQNVYVTDKNNVAWTNGNDLVYVTARALSEAGNSAPRIVRTSPIPSIINPGETYIFKWAAVDNDKDMLAWSVDWGDGSPAEGLRCSGSIQKPRIEPQPVSPPATGAVIGETDDDSPGGGGNVGTDYLCWDFSASHSWLSPGTYKVVAVVSDNKGGTDKSSFMINVGLITTGCNSTEIIQRGPLGNPGGTGEFEKLGLDISQHPEILKYRIQWFSGYWSPWYTPGKNDVDWKVNLDGTKRRVWSYFDDHVHEIVACSGDVNKISKPRIVPQPVSPPVDEDATASGSAGIQRPRIESQPVSPERTEETRSVITIQRPKLVPQPMIPEQDEDVDDDKGSKELAMPVILAYLDKYPSDIDTVPVGDPLLIEHDISGNILFKYVKSELFDPGCEAMSCKNHRATYNYMENYTREAGASVFEFESAADARKYLEMRKTGYSFGYITDYVNDNIIIILRSDIRPSIMWLDGNKVVEIMKLESLGAPAIRVDVLKSLASAYLEKYPSDLTGTKSEGGGEEELLAILLKFDTLKAKLANAQNQVEALIQFYSSRGDAESVSKYTAVDTLLKDSIKSIDDLKAFASQNRNDVPAVKEKAKTTLATIKENIKSIIDILLGQTTEPVVCTRDAKVCPDGTVVGRIAPNCEFRECPETNDSIVIGNQTVSLSCEKDSDCRLIAKSSGAFICCHPLTVCNNLSSEDWISINYQSYSEKYDTFYSSYCRNFVCTQNAPAPCRLDNYIAQCVNNICEKVPSPVGT